MKYLYLTFATIALLFASGCCTSRHSAANASKLVILKAVYGVDDQKIEVTDDVAALVDGDTIHLGPIWSLGKVDPAFGKVKTVVIAYRFKGRLQLASFNQHQEIVLPPK